MGLYSPDSPPCEPSSPARSVASTTTFISDCPPTPPPIVSEPVTQQFATSPGGSVLRQVKKVETAWFQCESCSETQRLHVLFDDHRLLSCDRCFGPVKPIVVIDLSEDSESEK